MTQQKKQSVTVRIHNKQYTIVASEQTHHVRLIANLVDQRMRDIQQNDNSLDRSEIAVLAAVNMMSEYVKLEEKYQKLKDSKERKED